MEKKTNYQLFSWLCLFGIAYQDNHWEKSFLEGLQVWYVSMVLEYVNLHFDFEDLQATEGIKVHHRWGICLTSL
jgi:hypothetical protein